MRLIRTIEIKYFRSIYTAKLKACNNLNIISGRNDVGKSNVLRALNVFFNGQTDWENALVFTQDFSIQRLDQVRKESVKGKQFIQVAIEFLRPPNYKGSLPEKFTVKRTWHRDQPIYSQSDNLIALEKQGKCPSTIAAAQMMLPKFLNRVHYEYVPAIKDRAFYNHLLSRLQSSLLGVTLEKGNPITTLADDLAEHIGGQVTGLRDDFSRATGLGTSILPPQELASLFQAFQVSVPAGEDQVPLYLRGDGMQARYIPSVLHYIAQNSSSFFIWGFEEPENSLEYANADKLAADFQEIYSKEAQIFLTSHSPAVVSRQGDDLSCYRITQSESKTEVNTVILPLSSSMEGGNLSEDIGLLRIQQEIHKEYEKQLEDLNTSLGRVAALELELTKHTRPLLLVEGTTDVKIIDSAWDALFPDVDIPFVTRAADSLANQPETSSGGTGAVAKAIESIHPADQRHVLALLDHDQEGIDTFAKLSKNFKNSWVSDWKKDHKNGFAYAFTLAVADENNPYATCSNLCIEFMFDDACLERKDEKGYGLTIVDANVNVGIGKNKKLFPIEQAALIEDMFGDLKYYRRITGGKKVFAENIVPQFTAQNFTQFRNLFSFVLDILDLEIEA